LSTKNGDEYVLRGLQFEEMHRWSSFITVSKGTSDTYDIDDQIIEDVLSACILHPEEPNISLIMEKAGLVVEMCNRIMSVTQFENMDFLINCYIDKLRSANMVYGVIRMRLVALYGVAVLEKLRDLKAEEIIELLVYGEYSTESIGQFSEIINKPEILPRDRKGKIIEKEMMNLLFGKDKPNTPAQNKREKTPHKPKTIDDLQSMMDKSQQANRGPSEEELQTMDSKTHAQMKKDGKIPDFQQEVKGSMNDATSALQKKIEEDKAKFGTGAADRTGGFRGNIQDLINK